MSAPLDPASDPASPTGVLDLPTAGGKVIRGSVLRGGAYAATIALGIISASLLTRHLGVVDFGRYVTVISIVTVAIGMSDVGLLNIGVREYSIREGADRDFTMKNLLGLRIALTGVAVVIAVAFAAAAGYPAVMVVGTMVAAIGFMLTTVQHSLGVPLSAGLRLGWVAGLDVLRQAGLVLAVVVLVLIGAGLLGSLPLRCRSRSCSSLLTVLGSSRGTIPFVPAFDTRAWGRLLRLVLPYVAASAIGAVYVSLVVVLTSLVASQEETGYFSAAFRVFSVLSAVPSLLVVCVPNPGLPRVTTESAFAMPLQRLWDASLVIGAGRSRPAGGGAPVAIAVVAGPEYEPSSLPPDHGRSAVRVFLRGHLGLWAAFHRRLSQPSRCECDRVCRRGRACACRSTRIWSGREPLWPLYSASSCSRLRSTSADVVAGRPPRRAEDSPRVVLAAAVSAVVLLIPPDCRTSWISSSRAWSTSWRWLFCERFPTRWAALRRREDS